MCHDPNTAERFYVALPDKVMGYDTRKLRLRALESAVANSCEDDGSDDSEPLSADTLETTSEDEEPVDDYQLESSSSLASEELRVMHQKHVRQRCRVSFSSS